MDFNINSNKKINDCWGHLAIQFWELHFRRQFPALKWATN